MKPRQAVPYLLLAWALIFAICHYRLPGLEPRAKWALLLLPNPLRMKAAVLPGYAKILAGWAALVGAGLSVGAGLLLPFRLRMTRLERALARLLLGWGALSTAMALLGLAGLWSAGLVFGGAAVAAAAGARRAWLARARTATLTDSLAEPWGAADKLLLALLLLGSALTFFGTFMPDLFYDAHVYHLALPQLYWARGAITPTPFNCHAGIPMDIEMLYSLALPLGGDRAAHLVHWTLGLGAGAAAFCAARRLVSRRAGLIAALIFLSTPLVSVLSWKAGVELGLAFFESMALLSLLRGVAVAEERARWWALAAVCAGLAAASKYPAWPFVGVMAGVIALHGRRAPAQAAKNAALFLAIAGAIAAVWPLRNLWFYGNPLFPFGSPWTDWRQMLHDAHKRDLAAAFGTWAGFKALLSHPWTLLGSMHSDFDDLGPLVIMGLPLGLAARRDTPERRALLAVTGLAWLAWCLSSEMVRFFLPVIPLVAVVYGTAIEAAVPKAGRAAAYALLAFVFCENTLLAADWLTTYEAKDVILGLEAVDSYRERAHVGYPRPYEKAARFVRETLPRSAKILVLGDARGFGLERDFAAASIFDETPLKGYLRRAQTPEQLRDLLRADGYTHMLINVAELRAYGAQRWIKVDKREEAVYDACLAKYMRVVFEQQDPPGEGYKTWAWTAVYEIEAAKP